MYPRPIQRLIEHFQKLPGIGPKQAAKFAFRAIRMPQDELDAFADAVKNIRRETAFCTQCFLTYTQDGNPLCPICRNTAREQRVLCVTETERDAYTIEKSGAYAGVYHVLGKISFEEEAPDSPTLAALKKRIKKLGESTEVILAMNANTDGQMLTLYLERELAGLSVKVSRLGRGLSSGIEIEYADRDTLADALTNRK
jgi:recombination protein RecR